jgi:hypothetical protein
MAKVPEEKVPGRLMRTLKTGWLGSAVASSYLGGKIVDRLRGDEGRADAELSRHLQNAKRIASTMKELRGPLMKVGQLLSTHAEALPGEYGEVLRSLQSSAPPMSYETIRDVIEMDLGATPGGAVQGLLAHGPGGGLARPGAPRDAEGRDEVAVKVQYPGAVASVEGDLKNMKFGAAMVKRLLADVVGNDRLDFTPVAEEIAEHLAQETDYCREAYNAQLLGKLFEGVDWVVIPRVHCPLLGAADHHLRLPGRRRPGRGAEAPRPGLPRARRERLSDAYWFQMLRGECCTPTPTRATTGCCPTGASASWTSAA